MADWHRQSIILGKRFISYLRENAVIIMRFINCHRNSCSALDDSTLCLALRPFGFCGFDLESDTVVPGVVSAELDVKTQIQ